MRGKVYIALALIGALGFQALAQDVKQVSVSVKIIEFLTSKGFETGLSAYFKRRSNTSPYGFVSPGNGAISAGDVTFPTSTTAGITVFLNNIADGYGDFEAVLQALVDQNRAFILSRPKAMVPVGVDPATSAPFPPTKIETVQDIPYEKTVAIGATTVQTTDFRPTGVSLSVQAPQIIDDNANPNSGDDTYVQLTLTAGVNEEGQRIIVALDDLLAANGNIFATTSNAISVPEFVNRSITTTVWVKNGEVLILGGLYRNSESRTLSTLPGLPRMENFVNSAVERIVPFGVPDAPLSSSVGNNKSSNTRRELVFLIKTDVWKPVDTVASDLGFSEEEEANKEKRSPADVISGVLESITGIQAFEGNGNSENVVKDDTLTKQGKEDARAKKAKKQASEKAAEKPKKDDKKKAAPKAEKQAPKKKAKDTPQPSESTVGQQATPPPVQEAQPAPDTMPLPVPAPAPAPEAAKK
jgi:hypothetical protein